MVTPPKINAIDIDVFEEPDEVVFDIASAYDVRTRLIEMVARIDAPTQSQRL